MARTRSATAPRHRLEVDEKHLVATVVCLVWSRHIHTDFLVQSVREDRTRRFKIVPRLEVHPALGLHPKEAPEAQRRIRRDPPLAMDNLIHTTRRHSNRLGHMVLAELHRLQKILQENPPQDGWAESRAWSSSHLSVNQQLPRRRRDRHAT
jgi:hypothetical protein